MNQRRRPRPTNLARKLRQIRHVFGLSQSEMAVRLDAGHSMNYGRISEYELGRREPSLLTLLAYARVAGVHLEDLVDDTLMLPEKLPGDITYPKRRH
jgi:transcriptional regulator with XRE-family HTH domain